MRGFWHVGCHAEVLRLRGVGRQDLEVLLFRLLASRLRGSEFIVLGMGVQSLVAVC